MATVSVHLRDGDGTPTVEVLRLDSGERFMIVRLTESCRISLPGYDELTVFHALVLADAIRTAAEALKADLEQAVVT